MADNRRNRGTMPTWKAITYALAFFGIGMLMWYIVPGLLSGGVNNRDTALSGNPAQREVHQRFDPAVDRLVHVQGGYTLAPTGEPVALEKNRLAPIMVSEEGLILYNHAPGQGGGGGAALNRQESGVPGIPQAKGPVYVELEDGRFQRLIQR